MQSLICGITISPGPGFVFGPGGVTVTLPSVALVPHPIDIAAGVHTGSLPEGDIAGAAWVGHSPLAHEASHRLGGADELGVAGLSGLLGDSQNPLIHGYTLHQNRFSYIAYPAAALNTSRAGPSRGFIETGDRKIETLDFDQAVSEHIGVAFPLPVNAVRPGGTWRICVSWTVEGVLVGNCRWGMWLAAVAEGEDLCAGGATVSDGVTTAAGASHERILSTIGFDTPALAIGDLIAITLFRSGGDAADTLNGDARLISLSLRYTADE